MRQERGRGGGVAELGRLRGVWGWGWLSDPADDGSWVSCLCSNIPLNTYKNKEPHTGKIVSVRRCVGANAPGETCHIIIDHGGAMPFWEGQSYGVIPPGTNPKNGKPNSVRLYSIASSRCVRRQHALCRRGVCSADCSGVGRGVLTCGDLLMARVAGTVMT